MDLILFLVFPEASYHGCIALVLAKLYSNSLLVLLNSRMTILGSRAANSGAEDAYRAHSFMLPAPQSRRPDVGSRGTQNSGVHVHEQTWFHTDHGSAEMIALGNQVKFLRHRSHLRDVR